MQFSFLFNNDKKYFQPCANGELELVVKKKTPDTDLTVSPPMTALAPCPTGQLRLLICAHPEQRLETNLLLVIDSAYNGMQRL